MLNPYAGGSDEVTTKALQRAMRKGDLTEPPTLGKPVVTERVADTGAEKRKGRGDALERCRRHPPLEARNRRRDRGPGTDWAGNPVHGADAWRALQHARRTVHLLDLGEGAVAGPPICR